MAPKKEDEKKEEDPNKVLMKLHSKFPNSIAFHELSDQRVTVEQVPAQRSHPNPCVRSHEQLLPLQYLASRQSAGGRSVCW